MFREVDFGDQVCRGGGGRLVKGWVRRGQRQAEVRWRRWPDQVRLLQVEQVGRWRRQLGGQVEEATRRAGAATLPLPPRPGCPAMRN